jgi:hypothetical protein
MAKKRVSRHATSGRPFRVSDTVIEAVAELLDTVTNGTYHESTDEVFTQCLMCGEWEGHADECPVPALKKWQEG